MHLVLGIGYYPEEREAVRIKWREYDVGFHFVHTAEEAVRRLRHTDYICVTICSGRVSKGHLDTLRSAGPVPLVVLSPDCSIVKRAEYFQHGAMDFILHEHQWQKENGIGSDAIRYYLDSPDKATDPLTIITTEDIYFCLEYRTVRVREQEIDLTPFEFDALHLLLSNPKRTLTFEIISVRVWGEEYIDNPPKAVNNLISRLRNKLKVAPDVQIYIKSIHGVGYRYDADI